MSKTMMQEVGDGCGGMGCVAGSHLTIQPRQTLTKYVKSVIQEERIMLICTFFTAISAYNVKKCIPRMLLEAFYVLLIIHCFWAFSCIGFNIIYHLIRDNFIFLKYLSCVYSEVDSQKL